MHYLGGPDLPRGQTHPAGHPDQLPRCLKRDTLRDAANHRPFQALHDDIQGEYHGTHTAAYLVVAGGWVPAGSARPPWRYQRTYMQPRRDNHSHPSDRWRGLTSHHFARWRPRLPVLIS